MQPFQKTTAKITQTSEINKACFIILQRVQGIFTGYRKDNTNERKFLKRVREKYLFLTCNERKELRRNQYK